MKGLSARNLRYMKTVAEAYPDESILQQLAARIPWFHNCVLLEKVKDAQGKDFRIDLLFYHFRLHCFVVIDLKAVEFEPEFGGKMNFYVSAVDDLLHSENDQPTIGRILCKTHDKTTVKYSLRDVNKPIGVSTYQLRERCRINFKEGCRRSSSWKWI